METDNTETIVCAKCSSILTSLEDRCKYCGSSKKILKIAFTETLELRDQFKLKAKEKINGKKNLVLDVFQGFDLNKSTGKLVNKEREIDKINDNYYEHIETFDGTLIHHCEEKLTAHVGHGSAKFKSQNNEK
jgi:hypothetical protein